MKTIYQIALLDEATSNGPEVVNEAETIGEVLAWVDEWFREPLGLTVVVRSQSQEVPG